MTGGQLANPRGDFEAIPVDPSGFEGVDGIERSEGGETDVNMLLETGELSPEIALLLEQAGMIDTIRHAIELAKKGKGGTNIKKPKKDKVVSKTKVEKVVTVNAGRAQTRYVKN